MKYNNLFEDGERVINKNTGIEMTVNRWSYAPKMRQYTYSVVEQPSTFYFEHELEKVVPQAPGTTEIA